ECALDLVAAPLDASELALPLGLLRLEPLVEARRVLHDEVGGREDLVEPVPHRVLNATRIDERERADVGAAQVALRADVVASPRLGSVPLAQHVAATARAPQDAREGERLGWRLPGPLALDRVLVHLDLLRLLPDLGAHDGLVLGLEARLLVARLLRREPLVVRNLVEGGEAGVHGVVDDPDDRGEEPRRAATRPVAA